MVLEMRDRSFLRRGGRSATDFAVSGRRAAIAFIAVALMMLLSGESQGLQIGDDGVAACSSASFLSSVTNVTTTVNDSRAIATASSSSQFGAWLNSTPRGGNVSFNSVYES